MTISIANDFSKTPGFRYKIQSPGISGEEFRDNILEPKYKVAQQNGEVLEVVLDGTSGYLTSFLEEAFGGLQRKVYPEKVSMIQIISNDEKHWIDTIMKRYIPRAYEEMQSKQ
ncbi:MAG: STAS-like domain-containing protein [Candidatus Paceibacterota bacterium]